MTEDSRPAINPHYGPLSVRLAAANSNRLRQLLLTASLMAANERHLGAVDPRAQRDRAVSSERTAQYGDESRSASVASQRQPHPYRLNVAQELNLITGVWTALSSP